MNSLILIMAVSAGLTALQLSVAEVRGPFRRMIRADPLIDAVVEAMTVKNRGCPVQELNVNTDPMRVMKEIEPFFGSEPTAADLEVRLICSDAVWAVVYSYYDDRQGGEQPLAQQLRRIEFSYEEFIDRYLVRWPSVTTTAEYQVLNDPVVAKIYSVLAQDHKKCDDLASGKLTVADTPQYSGGGWSGRKLEYLDFSLTFSCSSSGTTYQFLGKYFKESGYVTWHEISLSVAVP
jgi:hypothetical protein